MLRLSADAGGPFAEQLVAMKSNLSRLQASCRAAGRRPAAFGQAVELPAEGRRAWLETKARPGWLRRLLGREREGEQR